jgi:uncharacterized protein DUF6496
MPEERTTRRARRAKAQGKAPSTQASEFVHEEIEHVREGKHGARSAKQAIAIGLSKARRAGVKLPPPKPGTTSERTRKSAARDSARGRSKAAGRAPSARRSRATTSALEREGHAAASSTALGRNARAAAERKSPQQRSASARQAARTKSPAVRKAAARKAAQTRARRARAASS